MNARLATWNKKIDQELKKVWNINDTPLGKFRESGEAAFRLAKARVGEGPQEELDSVLNELCDIYLESPSEQRHDIRSFMKHQSEVSNSLLGYARRSSELIGATGDIQWLRRGLAALSIQDNRTDFRDTYGVLGVLYLAAAHIGIDPLPAFQEAAGLSSTDAWRGAGSLSTRDFLAQFHKSSYFAESVKPNLPK